MGKIIGYGKLGRSMPLTLAKCGNLGGDVEMVAVVKRLAQRHPDDTFLLLGRNSGEIPSEIGLPTNIVNPWTEWGWSDALKGIVARSGLKGVTLTSERQLRLRGIFDCLVGPTFDTLDGMVMWVGQHGTSNTPIPKVGDPSTLTKPQDWCAWYSGFMLCGINRWRDRDPWNREEVSLNADVRNRHKMRDLKWPLRHPILTQYTFTHPLKHERYGDPRPVNQLGGWRWQDYASDIGQGTWRSTVQNTYARLEINGLYPGTPFGDLISYNDDWNRPGNFGLFINEARAIGVRPELTRRAIMKKWVLPLRPHFIHGTWSKEALADFKPWTDYPITPAPWDQYYPKLHSVRCTLTTPSSGSGWATAKPWEAFAAGTVCFFHPAYDTQNHILADAPDRLQTWLRVSTVDDLETRITHLGSVAGRQDWLDIIEAQHSHFELALQDERYMKMMEERLYA
jgi:hypothetical protein